MSVKVWLVRSSLREIGEESCFLPPEDARREMENAFAICERYETDGIKAEWISEEECVEMSSLTRRDVFVLDAFKGSTFKYLSKTKAVIIGPRCLSCCLTEGSEIPPGPHPVYTIAMRNLVVSVTSVGPDVKKQLSLKIGWMGGRYEPILTAETTHLISNSVMSEKYNKAKSLKIPIMKPEWVKAIWDLSLTKNISAGSSEFNEFRVPIFYNLIICTTGLKKPEKNNLQAAISEHGGKLVGVLEVQQVNLLITDSSAVGSEKFKAAQTYEIPCVSSSWIFKSIEKGFAVPMKDFMVQNNKTSSPNRPSQLPNMSLDISAISTARNETTQCIYSDITNCSTPMNKMFAKKGRPNKLSAAAKELAQMVDSIEMKDVKHAGPFLDGCCIFVYGFNATRRDKLQRIVARAGAVCYNQPTESVTHALCGDPNVVSLDTYQNLMPRAIHVTIRWFVDSLNAKKTLDEGPYLVFPNEKANTSSKTHTMSAASPMSKRNLQLLRTPPKLPPVPSFDFDNPDEEEKDEIVQQYLEQSKTLISPSKEIENAGINANASSNNKTVPPPNLCNKIEDNPNNISSNNSPDIEIEPQIFEGLTFEIQDIDEETEQITQRILNAGGVVIPPKKGGSYIIVPMNSDEVHIENENSHVVTTIWLEDCFLKESVVTIDYYHKPIKIDSNAKPLDGLVFAISTYNGNEREYIMEVAVLLGGIVQSSLHRRQVKNSLRSTHLICPEPSGAKYNGAIAWGLPVVTSQWLLDCAVAKKRLPEEPYLVGQSTETSMKEKEPNLENEPKNVTSSIVQNEDPTVNKSSTPLQKLNNVAYNDTPKSQKKTLLGENAAMSPASRYIAMARQGLFGPESQGTPKRVSELALPSTKLSCTPPMEDALSTPNLALYSSVERRKIIAIKKGERPSSPLRTPKNPFDISVTTPESPFGAFLKRDEGISLMEKTTLKNIWKLCNEFDSPVEKQNKNIDTPVSELCRKFIKTHSNDNMIEKPAVARALEIEDVDSPRPSKLRKINNQDESTSSDVQLQNQLKQLNSILAGNENNDSPTSFTPRSFKGKRSINIGSPALSLAENIVSPFAANVAVEPESQLDTVKWDDMSQSGFSMKAETKPPKVYRFMLSLNIDNCEEIKKIIERLGGTVLENTGLELSATHLLCSRVVRSEKFLGCLASGRWILHPSYIIKSQEAGKFVDEECYEWGNPKSENLLGNDESERKFAASVHRWRSKITATGQLPFESFRVIMHIQEARKASLIRVLLAGGGKIINASPPFSGEINATHCLMEQKRMGLSQEDMVYLAARRIPVCPPLLLNSILVEDPPPDATEFAYPEYRKLIS